MKFSEVFGILFTIGGLAVGFGWLYIDTFGTIKIDSAFGVIGILFFGIGMNELNHCMVMDKLNEHKTT